MTPREKYIFRLLCEVEHDSIWGVAIKLFNKNPTLTHLRLLIDQLTSQANDNPESMAKVIGEELVEILLQKEVANG